MKIRAMPILLLACLLAGAFSGCLAKPVSTKVHVFASQGKFAPGWNYDGRATVPMLGEVYLDVDHATNKGRLLARVTIGGVAQEILFDTFAQAKPFHDGGVAHNLIEHGATGVGDTSIPRVDLQAAGWGKATYKMNGTTYKDPLSGSDTWVAHFMVIRNGVRDNASGAIYADAAKSTPYNPANASRGYSEPGDYELHLVLRNNTINQSQPLPVKQPTMGGGGGGGGGQPAPPGMYSRSGTLFTSTVAGGRATLTFNLTAGFGQTAPTQGQDITIRILSPGGQEVANEHLVGDNTNKIQKNVSFDVAEIGAYTYEVTGTLIPPGRWEIHGSVSPPRPLVLYFWWEDLVFGAEATKAADQKGFAATPGTSVPTTTTAGNQTMTVPGPA